MNEQITDGVKVSVSVTYQPHHSHPQENKYLFSYQIEIENLRDQPVRLLRRHWVIINADGIRREVSGDGVVGEQPIIQPGQLHQYGSWCPLTTAIGRMYGIYEMLDISTDNTFEVVIPPFDLVAPFMYN